MRAETGGGPSIASGSHVCSGSCADLAHAPPSRPSATRLTAVDDIPSAPANAPAKSSVPVCWISTKKASAIVASPTAFMTNAFLAAATASGRRCQKPISRYEARPTANPPAESHVQAVESCARSSASSPERATKETSAPAKATNTESVATIPAVRRAMRSPATVIARQPASGASRQSQAPAITSSPQEGQLVDVELELAARQRHDQAEADHDLGGSHRHHGEREDLAVLGAVAGRERDEGGG